MIRLAGDYNMGTAYGTIEISASTLTRAISALEALSNKMLVVSAAGALLFGYAIKSAADFEEQLARFSAVSDATEGDMNKIRAAALKMGQEAGIGATEVIRGWVELAKAGFTAQETMEGVGKAAVTLAAAGELEMAEATDTLAIAIRTFGLEAKDATHVADLLAGVANASLADVDDLATSFRYAAPVAQTLGISIDDLVVALGVFSQAGIRGSMAGTSLRGIFVALTAPSDKAASKMKELGIITEDGSNKMFDATGKAKSFGEMMQVLKDATAGLPPNARNAALAIIFQRRAMALAARAALDGRDGFNAMKEAAGRTTAEEVMTEKLDTLKGTLKKLHASFEAFMIQIGQIFTPILKAAAEKLKEFTDWLQTLSPETKKWIGYILIGTIALFGFLGMLSRTVAWALRMYKLFKDLSGAVKLVSTVIKSKLIPALVQASVAAATNPYVLIALAIILIVAALAALFVYWDKVWNFLMDNKWLIGVMAIFMPVILGIILIVGALRWLYDNWDEVWEGIKSVAKAVWDWLKGAWDDVEQAFEDTIDWLETAWDDVSTAVEDAFNDVIDFFKKLPGRILGFLESLPGRLLALGKQLLEWFLEGLKLAAEGLYAWYVRLPAFLLGVIVGLIWQFLQLGWKLLTALWDGIKLAWEEGVPFILELPGKLLQFGWDMLVGLWNGITAAAELTYTFFRELPGKVWAFFADVLTWLLRIGWDLLTGLWNGIVRGAEAVWTFFRELPGRILGFVSSAINWLLGTGRAILDGLWNGLMNGIGQIFDFFTGLPGQVLGWLGDAGSWLIQAGQEVVAGLWEGIQNGAAWLRDKISGFVSDVIDEFTSGFGIFSPSRITMDMGEKIAQGFGVGFRDNVPDFSKDIAKMVRSLKPGIRPGITIAAAGPVPGTLGMRAAGIVAPVEPTAGYAPVTNVYPSQGMDEDLLARRVARHQARRWREAIGSRGGSV